MNNKNLTPLLRGYVFSNNLQELISQSNLSVQEVYYILKDIFNDVEKMYVQQVEKEIKEMDNNGMDDEQLS